MNIFVLSTNFEECVQFHCDKHVVKMIVEHTQLLSNTVRKVKGSPIKIGAAKNINLLDGETASLSGGRININEKLVYAQTHENHPCSLWVGESQSNFDWLVELNMALIDEYGYRYNKRHACTTIMENIARLNVQFEDRGLTKFAQAMPEQYRNENAVKAYRDYYIGEKLSFAKWTHREIPYWIENV